LSPVNYGDRMLFSYFGRELNGFDHLYNCTFMNERQVELAVVFDWLNGRDLHRGLEVGNVLAHYDDAGHTVVGHTVVDRYEPATYRQRDEGCWYYQVDVFDTPPREGGYDWIVAISTLEHVRFDFDRFDPIDLNASFNAIAHLRKLLAPHGAMLVTFPCGFHPVLDDLVIEELTGAERACTLIRTEHGWVQTEQPTILPYGASTPWAESVFIGEFGAPLPCGPALASLGRLSLLAEPS
jgi:hypothetical protein